MISDPLLRIFLVAVLVLAIVGLFRTRTPRGYQPRATGEPGPPPPGGTVVVSPRSADDGVLRYELERLRAGVREHRDARGDDRCWRDDDTLYALLPEGYIPPKRDSAVELERCRQFIASRQHPSTVYVSPQRRIDELENLVRGLEDIIAKERG
jgi:hypothetical protein